MTKSKKTSEENEYFMKDTRLFLLWRATDEKLLPLKRGYISLYELFPVRQYSALLGFEDLRINTGLDDRFEIYFYSDAVKYKKLPIDEEILKNFSNKSVHKKILSSVKNIRENSFNSTDFVYLSSMLGDEAVKEIYLMPREGVTQDDVALKRKLNDYIQKFINGELLITDVNYFNFQKQKQLFIKLIREMRALEEFGRNFIIDNTGGLNPFHRNDSTLLIHTIFALEYLGYVTVLNLDFSEEDAYFTNYKINILPNESFKELIYQDFKKENPKTIIEGYDEKRGILSFSGKKISISKSGKETDASLLLKTLLKADGDDYLHNDEIYEDWGFNEADTKKASKNKIYFAGQKMNKDIQLATGIEDFLEVTTIKVRINPKYKQ